MPIGQVSEAMNPRSRYKQRHSDRLYRSVSPPMIVDATRPVDVVNVLPVFVRPPELHCRYLEIVVEYFLPRPLIVKLGLDVMLRYVAIGRWPESVNTLRPLLNVLKNVAVQQIVVSHVSEYIVVDRTQDQRIVVQSKSISKQ